MKFDKRIDHHNIRCVCTHNQECLGKFGYFAKNISELEDLDKCAKGICCFRDGEDFPFFRFQKKWKRNRMANTSFSSRKVV